MEVGASPPITMDEAPIRVCCFQRHFGVVCPDGLIMCQLCFARFPKEQLNKLPDGTYENICSHCAEQEKRMKN
jgi:hypothetical protein